jgi:hypothetical protein
MDPTFAHEFFDVARAQRVGDIPADACQNDILWEMGPLKAHRHRLSPSVFTLSHRGRSYLKWPQMNIATEPANAHLPPDQHLDVSPHVLRHTLLRKVANEKGVHYAIELSGHRSDRYIWRYVKPDAQSLADAIDDLE